jgi:hypothetical protein
LCVLALRRIPAPVRGRETRACGNPSASFRNRTGSWPSAREDGALKGGPHKAGTEKTNNADPPPLGRAASGHDMGGINELGREDDPAGEGHEPLPGPKVARSSPRLLSHDISSRRGIAGDAPARGGYYTTLPGLGGPTDQSVCEGV